MKEPNIRKQFADSEEQYKDGLITLVEYAAQLTRISKEWCRWKQNNKGATMKERRRKTRYAISDKTFEKFIRKQKAKIVHVAPGEKLCRR